MLQWNEQKMSTYCVGSTQKAEADPGSDYHMVEPFKSCSLLFGGRFLKLTRRTKKSLTSPSHLSAVLKIVPVLTK
jgi:hypothetical protein